MQGFTIQPKRSKAEAFLEIRDAILSQCDEDIKLAFTPHSFTLEPLLLQLVREMRQLNEHYRTSPSNVVRATDDATERNHELNQREPEATPKASNARTMGEVTGGFR